MGYTSKYAQSEMSKATGGKDKEPNPETGGMKVEKMTRKDAKGYKKRMEDASHKAGNMSVRKIRKTGSKASM